LISLFCKEGQKDAAHQHHYQQDISGDHELIREVRYDLVGRLAVILRWSRMADRGIVPLRVIRLETLCPFRSRKRRDTKTWISSP
jgi:hypothetical protein